MKQVREVVITAAVRTPVGTFNGSLSSLTAPKLGSLVIGEVLKRSGVKPDQVDEVILGNVLSAGEGQAPARQAAIFAGLPTSVACMTINKVCGSGLKSVMLAAQGVALGDSDIVVAGAEWKACPMFPTTFPERALGIAWEMERLLTAWSMTGCGMCIIITTWEMRRNYAPGNVKYPGRPRMNLLF